MFNFLNWDSSKYKSAERLNNGYYVDEQALESLMKKILQQQENLRRDAKVAKLESILDIEVRNCENIGVANIW